MLSGKHYFPIDLQPVYNDLKYLGYFLNPNDYSIVDWLWLVKKVEKNICSRCYRKLYFGVILSLLNTVLNNIPIYWFSL